jgi:ribosome biogenesis GTPase A
MNMKQDNIHWYPGHMAVATREIRKGLKIVDMIIELIDARAPISSRHPFLANYDGNKLHLIIMTKTDLADPYVTVHWEAYFEERRMPILALNVLEKNSAATIVKKALEIGHVVFEKQIAKGMRPQPLRAMVIGIPNVGKSTLINRLAKRKAAVVEDRPGVTRAPQWIKPNDKIWLLDTPGVLPMNYEHKLTSTHLAAIGAIKRDVLPLESLTSYIYKYVKSNYPKLLFKYLQTDAFNDYDSFINAVGLRFGLMNQGIIAREQAINRFYDDFKAGTIGRVSLEVAY